MLSTYTTPMQSQQLQPACLAFQGAGELDLEALG